MRTSRWSPLAGLLTLLLVASGCSLIPFGQPRETLAPPEPFGDFAVGEFGGVDGRQNILRVRSDGVAVLISREPAAGRLSDSDLARLRELLTSEQFRLEVAREAALEPQDPMRCSDQIITEVRMGSLALSRSGPCGAKDLPPAPAFTEILALVGPARQGVFAAPVGDVDPRLVPVRLERLGSASYVIDVDAKGVGTLTGSNQASRNRRLTTAQQDALRLLLPLVDAVSASPCTSSEYYRIRIGDGEPRPDCSMRGRYPEFRAAVTLLEDAFDV